MKTLKFAITTSCLLAAIACQEEEIFPNGGQNSNVPTTINEDNGIPITNHELIPLNKDTYQTFMVITQPVHQNGELYIQIEDPQLQAKYSSFFIMINNERVQIKDISKDMIIVDLPSEIKSGHHHIKIYSTDYELLGSGHFRI